MSPSVAVLLCNAASTWALAGLIWTIQLVHYPAFHFVSAQQFPAFTACHQRRISWIVVPLMLVELVTATALPWLIPNGVSRWVAWTGLLLLLIIWGCTFAIQVPQHTRLSRGYDRATVQRLVQGNWVRTTLWSLRAGLMLGALGQAWSAHSSTL